MALLKRSTFKYGIHIPDMKYLTEKKAIEVMPASERVFISLAQHIGKPAIPTVAVGDKVARGQLIGKADGFISASVYSSVSGEVEEIKPIVNCFSQKQIHIVIKNNFLDTTVSLNPVNKLNAKEIIDRVGEAGLVGLGGAGFPTVVKLTPPNPIDIILINAAECEPYLTCDHRIMLENSDEIVQGSKLLSTALNGAKVYIGIELNKPDAIQMFSKFDSLIVVPLKKKYPQGSEKQLIYACTKRKVASGKLPASSGVCVLNVQTVKEIYDAVHRNKPLYERVITISGKGVAYPKNIIVRNGTPYKDIIEFCGGLKDSAKKIIAGGPMMGKVLSSLDGYIRKTDSGILALEKGEVNEVNPSACISCARCSKVCPMHLMPMYIELFTGVGDYERANYYGASNCFECGACAYVCPAKRDIVGAIQLCKQKLRELK